MEKVDEDRARGSGAGICQEAVIGVYIDGLWGLGVLAKVDLVENGESDLSKDGMDCPFVQR